MPLNYVIIIMDFNTMLPRNTCSKMVPTTAVQRNQRVMAVRHLSERRVLLTFLHHCKDALTLVTKANMLPKSLAKMHLTPFEYVLTLWEMSNVISYNSNCNHRI